MDGLASFAKATQGPSLSSLGVTKNAETTPELLVGFEHTRERKEIASAILAERAF